MSLRTNVILLLQAELIDRDRLHDVKRLTQISMGKGDQYYSFWFDCFDCSIRNHPNGVAGEMAELIADWGEAAFENASAEIRKYRRQGSV